MEVSIIGTGYVGLVTGVCLSRLGHKVTCIDQVKKNISLLSKGTVPFHEPLLEEMLKENIHAGNISFSSSYKKACQNNIIFICIDTPAMKNGDADLSNISKCLQSLKNNLQHDALIIVKSTVPVGTTDIISDKLNKYFSLKDIAIDVCSNPEFLREGKAVNDFLYPDRIIVGANSKKSKALIRKLYAKIIKKKNNLLFMSTISAELTKYSSNAMLASRISFINEISLIALKVGANIQDISTGMGLDSRIGDQFLNAGLGYGGSCFPKDIQAITSLQNKLNLQSWAISSIQEANDQQFQFFYNKILNAYSPKELKKITLSIWGLSFKPDTDDIREAPAIRLSKLLLKKHIKLRVYDPKATQNTRALLRGEGYKNIVYCKSKYAALKKSSGLIICTEWDEFLSPDIKQLSKMTELKIFDGRNILDRLELETNNFYYESFSI